MEGIPKIDVSPSTIIYKCCGCEQCDNELKQGLERKFQECMCGSEQIDRNTVCEVYSTTIVILSVFSVITYVVSYYWMSVLLPDANRALTYWLSELFLIGLSLFPFSVLTVMRWNCHYVLFWLYYIVTAELVKFAIYLLGILCALPYYYGGIFDDVWSGYACMIGLGSLVGAYIIILTLCACCIGSVRNYKAAKQKIIDDEVERIKSNNAKIENTTLGGSQQNNNSQPVVISVSDPTPTPSVEGEEGQKEGLIPETVGEK